jgi:hypothetical protein
MGLRAELQPPAHSSSVPSLVSNNCDASAVMPNLAYSSSRLATAGQPATALGAAEPSSLRKRLGNRFAIVRDCVLNATFAP